MKPLDIVILGLAMRSSWGNGHATTYRGLVRALRERGHRVLFLERDVPWYADNQDADADIAGGIAVYADMDELADQYADDVSNADVVMVGSYVPDGVAVGNWVQATATNVTAFYDIDTPVTLAQLAAQRCDYIDARSMSRYDLYLSFTGGPTLGYLAKKYGAHALPFYCAVDPTRYFPQSTHVDFDLGYMGTYSDDRQPTLERLLLDPARSWNDGRFVVAGAQFPASVEWPKNVEHIEHVGPAQHRAFYNAQRFTLNVTRADMIRAGWSPSVRLFEAAACGVPIISDAWPGLDELFEPDTEILIARDATDVLHWLRDTPEEQRCAIGEAARRRVLAEHTAAHRAQTLERYIAHIAPRGHISFSPQELVS